MEKDVLIVDPAAVPTVEHGKLVGIAIEADCVRLTRRLYEWSMGATP